MSLQRPSTVIAHPDNIFVGLFGTDPGDASAWAPSALPGSLMMFPDEVLAIRDALNLNRPRAHTAVIFMRLMCAYPIWSRLLKQSSDRSRFPFAALPSDIIQGAEPYTMYRQKFQLQRIPQEFPVRSEIVLSIDGADATATYADNQRVQFKVDRLPDRIVAADWPLALGLQGALQLESDASAHTVWIQHVPRSAPWGRILGLAQKDQYLPALLEAAGLTNAFTYANQVEKIAIALVAIAIQTPYIHAA